MILILFGEAQKKIKTEKYLSWNLSYVTIKTTQIYLDAEFEAI